MKRALRESTVATVTGIAFTLLFLLVNLWSPRTFEERVESLALDYRFHIRNALKGPVVPEDILIVSVDEESLARYGRWPWGRTLQAELVGRILSGNPSVLGIDIFYGEAESAQSDHSLGAVFEEHSEKIVLASGFDMEGRNEPVPDFLLDKTITKIRHYSELASSVEVFHFKSKDPVLHGKAKLGHVFNPPDIDGKVRWEYLYIKYGDDFYPSLSLAASAIALGKNISEITINGNKGVIIGNVRIPTDTHGRMRINYLGREKTFTYISASDVLGEEFDPSALSGKIVLLGTSALSTYDDKVTPFSANMPGVEKNATVIENIMRGKFIEDAPLSIESLIILSSGFFLTLLLPGIRAKNCITVFVMMIIFFSLLNQYVFTYHGINVNFSYPILNISIIFIFQLSVKYLAEEKKSRNLRRIFSNYVSPKIIADLLRNPDAVNLDGKRREVTVLFSDIKGFTTFSESRDPEEVVGRLNEYLQEMTEIIFRWDGTLDKFLGDAILAFWGAPVGQPDHAERAIRCAMEMSERLDQLKHEWERQGKEILDCGIGVNSGIALVGNIGALNRKMDYTVIGDHVNLGSRVAALTREYGARIIITEFTYRKAKNLIDKDLLTNADVLEIGTVDIRGREMPVTLFQLKPATPHPKLLQADPL